MPDLPKLLSALVPWVEEGRCSVTDLEFYEAFNDQYRPADWTRNEAADEELLTFAQDGAGGQYALWVGGSGGLESAPVVKLGDDGDLIVLGRDLLDFAWLLSCGIEPIGIAEDITLPIDLVASEEMQAWVSSQAPGRVFGNVREILGAASQAFPALVTHIRSLCVDA